MGDMGEAGYLRVGTPRGDSGSDGAVNPLAPSEGPVYLEGRLVLSLSFGGGAPAAPSAAQAHLSATCEDLARDGALVERYRLWDDLAGAWHGDDLEVLRLEECDLVLRTVPQPTVLWQGAVDTRARVVPAPDLDGEGMAAAGACDLCWRRV